MNIYGKVLIIGIIGLTIIGIVLGVSSASFAPTFELPAISSDIIILYLIMQMPEPGRTTMLLIWLLFFFLPSQSSE